MIDECHEAICEDSNDWQKKGGGTLTDKLAIREMLGVGQPNPEAKFAHNPNPNFKPNPNRNPNPKPNPEARALRCDRNAIWGITGTPMLSSEERTTELASLIGGTYVTGGSKHWRRLERASGRLVPNSNPVPLSYVPYPLTLTLTPPCRDIFLDNHDTMPPSREYRTHRRAAAQV